MHLGLNEARPLSFGFLLLPEYSMIAVTSAVEPLRMANRMSSRNLYSWAMLTEDGKPVAASNGIVTLPAGGLDYSGKLDILFVCGGMNIDIHSKNEVVINWLRKQASRGLPLGALCTGTYILAKSELLHNVRCTVHWEIIDVMREEFPDLLITPQLFEIDGGRFTCSGGQAPLDMIVGIIHQLHGRELASQISDELLCEHIRDRYDKQKIPLQYQLGTSRPHLVSLVALMESNIEDPLSLTDLARHVKLSRRQVQRLFLKHLDVSPTRYYLSLRLNKARQLLHFTTKSIMEISLACGFVSAPHFSKCYRDYYGISPSEERSRGREAVMIPQQNVSDLISSVAQAQSATNF